MQEFQRHLITAALPYANGPLHIGHLTGAYLPADVYVRFLRMMDKDVVFICGSDEHGAAITMRAMKENLSPQEIIDKYHTQFKDTFSRIGISFDHYDRTSSKRHHNTSQDIFRTLYKNGKFTEIESNQYYDEKFNQFLADRYITGTCPKCGYESAYGDQCEKCGSSLNPTDLINPKSVLSNETPILKSTRHWYFPLDQHASWLSDYIVNGKVDGVEHHDPGLWKNHVIGQCKSWIDNGLQARAMTRDLDWGVDVPQEIPGSKGKKLYVWLDAPIGYISATQEWAEKNDKNWKDYWQSSDSQLIHFIGKDNIVFHCVIFPAILKAHGDYILPHVVPANQFMNLEGDKISTSRNWAVWVHEYLDELPGYEDALRYYLIKNMPEQKDSEFTWKSFQEAYNNELVNNLSNFIHRVLVLVHKFYDGNVPNFDPDVPINSVEDSDLGGFHDSECIYLFDQLHVMCDSLRNFDFRNALKIIMDISASGNLLLQKNEPWKMIKEDPDAVEVVMNLSLHYVTALSVAIQPFLPFTSDKIRKLLNLPVLKDGAELVRMLDQLAEGELLLQPGHKLSEASYIFTKIEDSVIDKQIQKLSGSKVQTAKTSNMNYPVPKSEISYDEFMKMDIRTARILHAERVPKADKLLKLELDLGYETRTVVSGIAEHYEPEKIIGQEVSLLANLAPRVIRGVESKGMILMAEDENGKLSFVSPSKNWSVGFTIK
ncbi:MAG: methionine--tRNA ligase [Saprospiraceae bacterium]|nr:methionine--tRNA ligase [Saprospiraceae bacterium]